MHHEATLSPAALVKQREENDCAVAALATFANVSYDYALATLGALHPEGTSVEEVLTAVFRIGIPVCHLVTYEALKAALGEEVFNESDWPQRGLLEQEEVKRYVPGRRAMLNVRPKNPATYSHWVVWDREKMLDPGHSAMAFLGDATIYEALVCHEPVLDA